MGLQTYKAQKNGKGCLAHWTFNSKDNALYLELVRQTGWNEAQRTGSFKNGEKLFLKFTAPEIGGLLRAIRNHVEIKFFHKSKDSQTQINFVPYTAKDSDEIVGMGFSIQPKNKEQFRIGYNLDEAELLLEYFIFVLNHFFSAIYAEDKANAIAYAKKNDKSKSSQNEDEQDDSDSDDENDEDDEEAF